jgi:hypothetical protein
MHRQFIAGRTYGYESVMRIGAYDGIIYLLKSTAKMYPFHRVRSIRKRKIVIIPRASE